MRGLKLRDSSRAGALIGVALCATRQPATSSRTSRPSPSFEMFTKLVAHAVGSRRGSSGEPGTTDVSHSREASTGR